MYRKGQFLISWFETVEEICELVELVLNTAGHPQSKVATDFQSWARRASGTIQAVRAEQAASRVEAPAQGAPSKAVMQQRAASMPNAREPQAHGIRDRLTSVATRFSLRSMLGASLELQLSSLTPTTSDNHGQQGKSREKPVRDRAPSMPALQSSNGSSASQSKHQRVRRSSAPELGRVFRKDHSRYLATPSSSTEEVDHDEMPRRFSRNHVMMPILIEDEKEGGGEEESKAPRLRRRSTTKV